MKIWRKTLWYNDLLISLLFLHVTGWRVVEAAWGRSFVFGKKCFLGNELRVPASRLRDHHAPSTCAIAVPEAAIIVGNFAIRSCSRTLTSMRLTQKVFESALCKPTLVTNSTDSSIHQQSDESSKTPSVIVHIARGLGNKEIQQYC